MGVAGLGAAEGLCYTARGEEETQGGDKMDIVYIWQYDNLGAMQTGKTKERAAQDKRTSDERLSP